MNDINGLCHCGCGGKAPIAEVTRTKFGWVKGQPKRFINGHQTRGKNNPHYGKRGKSNGAWKGGRLTNQHGYVEINLGSGHPWAWATGYALEHRIIMARHLDRALLPTETVHHIDGDRQNNDIRNLELRVGRHGPGATGSHCAA